MATAFSAPPFDGAKPSMPQMVDGPLDPMTMAHLRISASRAKIHIHDEAPCPDCLQDILGCGLYTLALLNRIADLEAELGGEPR